MTVRASLATGLLLAAAGCNVAGELVPIGTAEARVATDAAVRWLNVKNAAGSIRVTPARGEEVVVHVEVSVRESLATQFPAADAARDFELVRERDAIWVRSRHLEGGATSDWQLDIAVEAPPRMHWTLMQSAGSVHAQPDGGDVVVNVSAGEITLGGRAGRLELVTTAGAARLDLAAVHGGSVHAASGEIRLRLGESVPREPLLLETSSGSIDIELPPAANVDVELLASVGAVNVGDLAGVTTESSVTGNRATGSLGRGGPLLRATAGVGSVSLRVAR